jgi:formate hydrogenlyase subunit 3/multisubunit Na+/H+ antiporter MnhD subunit
MCWVLILIALSGLPPLIGFYFKLIIFQQLVSLNYISLAFYVYLTSIFSFAYYFRIVFKLQGFNIITIKNQIESVWVGGYSFEVLGAFYICTFLPILLLHTFFYIFSTPLESIRLIEEFLEIIEPPIVEPPIVEPPIVELPIVRPHCPELNEAINKLETVGWRDVVDVAETIICILKREGGY